MQEEVSNMFGFGLTYKPTALRQTQAFGEIALLGRDRQTILVIFETRP